MKLKINKKKSDNRGSLVVFEQHKDIPFEIKRVFYINDVPVGEARGHHAHFKTKQFLTVISGSCVVELNDRGIIETFVLDSPYAAVYQKDLVWGHMHSFSRDCILLVFADTLYDPGDYIHNFGDYMKHVGK